MQSLYPEKLLLRLESGRIGGSHKDIDFSGNVCTNIFLSWHDLQEHQLNELARTKSIPRKREYLSKCLLLDARYPDVDGDEVATKQAQRRRNVFLDLAVQSLTFCTQAKYSTLKTSTFFSIVNALHLAAAEQPGPPMPLEKAYGLIENLLLRHGIERPPFAVAIFNPSDVKLAANHIFKTYIRHLKLYQYVFGAHNTLTLQATSTTASRVDQTKFKALEDGKFIPQEEKKTEGEGEGGEQPGASVTFAEDAKPEEPEMDLNSYLTTDKDKELFQKVLAKRLEGLQEEMAAKMVAQQKAFAKRLGALEGSGTGRSGRKK